jgi:S1-C subfamily serine protease
MSHIIGGRMRRVLIFCVAYVSIASQCQNIREPLTHVQACSKFSDAVVEVITDTMSGTGFLVSADGWVITAFHVVADPSTLIPYQHTRVAISGHGTQIPAEIVSPLDKLAGARDFAILKIDETQLPKLDMGIENDVKLGSPISIIGFPLSAIFPHTAPIPRFCLNGTVAAQASFPLGNLEFLHTVYFQGVSIKGISGAPVILLETGKVIGIVTTKLAGINKSLEDVGSVINTGPIWKSGCRRDLELLPVWDKSSMSWTPNWLTAWGLLPAQSMQLTASLSLWNQPYGVG